jgi:8-oxo-dGTP diphosphatase
MGIILSIVARLLFIVLVPFGWCVALLTRITNWKRINKYFYDIAYSIDQLGNVVYQDLFQSLLVVDKGYLFGDPDRTISYALAKNQQINNLTVIGKWIAKALDYFDKDHLAKAIEANEPLT